MKMVKISLERFKKIFVNKLNMYVLCVLKELRLRLIKE